MPSDGREVDAIQGAIDRGARHDAGGTQSRRRKPSTMCGLFLFSSISASVFLLAVARLTEYTHDES